MNSLFPGTGPQVPVSQVQKSSGGVFSWFGFTCQLYHQLDWHLKHLRVLQKISIYLTLLNAARSPQWKLVPGGIQRPFFLLLPSMNPVRIPRRIIALNLCIIVSACTKHYVLLLESFLIIISNCKHLHNSIFIKCTKNTNTRGDWDDEELLNGWRSICVALILIAAPIFEAIVLILIINN